MIRKANPAVSIPQPGRPIQYQRASVIAGAVDLFWRKGVDGTPLDAIVSELSISRSTLYASFDGKNGLYASAIDLYLDQLDEVMVSPLRDGVAGISDLLRFFERLRDVLLGDEFPPGCLIINDMAQSDLAQSADPNPAARYSELFLAGFDAALRRAVAAGEIDDDDVQPLGALLLSQVIGLNVAAKAALSCELIDASLVSIARTLTALDLNDSSS